MQFNIKQIAWAVAECERQHVGPRSVMRLLQAFEYAMYKIGGLSLKMDDLNTIIELINGAPTPFRKTPAVFDQGIEAVAPQHIKRQLDLLFQAYAENNTTPVEFCKRLLEIHPWPDGNGRTAAVVYNFMLYEVTEEVIRNPLTLPEFNFMLDR